MTINNRQMAPLISVALEAGAAIRAIYDSGTVEVTCKVDSTPLTSADCASHAAITRGLQSFSSYPLLSEEGAAIPYEERETWKTFWLIDPLDGTKEFIGRNGEFTVNIALISDGIPVFGLVYCPVIRTLYFGSVDTGSFVVEDIDHETTLPETGLPPGARRLPVFRQSETLTVVASKSHRNPPTEEYLETLRKEHADLRIAAVGSSLKMCMIAEGSADIYPRLGPTMEWDTAAAHAVILYAGGSVTQFENGLPLTYNKKELLNPWFIAHRAGANR